MKGRCCSNVIAGYALQHYVNELFKRPPARLNIKTCKVARQLDNIVFFRSVERYSPQHYLPMILPYINTTSGLGIVCYMR